VFALAALLIALVQPPAVLGPRVTHDATPTYRFVSRGQGVRFRCSFDTPRLHRCSTPYTRRLRTGRHVLRVQAVDRKGRTSSMRAVAVRILPPSPLRQIHVSGRPFSLEDAFGSIWVANYLGGAVLRIDPATNRVVARIPVGGQPFGLTATPDAVWVGNNGSESVARIDPATNQVIARVEVGDRPIGIDYDGGYVWITNFGDGMVTKIDAGTNAVAARAFVPGEHEGVVHGFGSVWVPSEEGTLTRLDPETLAPTAVIRVGLDPDFALVADGSVWTTAYQDRVISRIDPATNTVASTLPADLGLQGIAFERGTFWVANYNEGRLLHLDESTGSVLGRWSTGGGPRDVLLADGSVWVANSRVQTVSRLGLGSRQARK